MNNHFTFRSASPKYGSFLLKGIFLSVLLMMLPCCISVMNGSENLHTTHTHLTGVETQEANTGTHAGKVAAGKTGTEQVHTTVPAPLPGRKNTPAPQPEHEKDNEVHDLHNEEQVITVKFPRLMRMAIMLFFMMMATIQFMPIT